jgi:hypothetical protein
MRRPLQLFSSPFSHIVLLVVAAAMRSAYLEPEKVNMNQGAESSISYLLARLKLEEVKRGIWKPKRA